jgi:HAE1 family hydrophobic/amphiphilic exporter-1
VESIYRKLIQGMDPHEAAIQGTDEVASAVIASTLTTLAVFVPLIFTQGLVGALMKDLSLTICFSIAMSLFAAMTLVPMLCSRLMKAKPAEDLAHLSPEELESLSLADLEVVTPWKLLNKVAKGIQKILKGMDSGYGRIIGWALDHVRLVVLSAIGLLVLSVALVFVMGMEFLPETDDGSFSVSFETRIGSTYESTSAKARQVEEIIRGVAGPYIVTMSSRVGDGGSNMSTTSVTLVKKEQRPKSIWDITRQVDYLVATQVMDVNHEVKIEGMASLATMSTGIKAPIVIHLSGDDMDTMYAYAKRIKDAAATVDGTRNLQISHKIGKPELQLRIKHAEAVSLGLTPMEIAAAIRAAYAGYTVTSFTRDEIDYDVRLHLQDADRNNFDRVRDLYFVNPRGKAIPLENVVEISEASGPVSITRKDRARIIDVTGSLTGSVPLSQVSAEIEAKVKALGEPPFGVRLEFTGSGSEMTSSFSGLMVVLVAAMLLVYMVMAGQFENLVNPLIIMFSVPFAVIGLVLALLITNTTFNIMSFTGAILLVGIVVKNAIILIDYIHLLRVRGMPLREAIIFGGKTRLKPILMTTLCTLLAMIPMALGLGDGAELRAPMARAIIGGLTTSTLITLVLIPTVLWMIETRNKNPKTTAATASPAVTENV